MHPLRCTSGPSHSGHGSPVGPVPRGPEAGECRTVPSIIQIRSPLRLQEAPGGGGRKWPRITCYIPAQVTYTGVKIRRSVARMSGLRRHAGVLGFLVCAGFVLAMVLSTPALATTTVQQVEGSNIIASDGTCGSWVFEPTPPQHTYHHVNGDSVTLPMVNKWSDQRAAGSPGRTLASSWSASYGGVGYGWGGLHHYSTGNDFGYETGSGSVPPPRAQGADRPAAATPGGVPPIARRRPRPGSRR